MSSPFNLTSPAYAKLLAEYLDNRVLEPSDFDIPIQLYNSEALLRERGYTTAYVARRPFIFLDYLNYDGSRYYQKGDTTEVNPYAIVRLLGEPVAWTGKELPKKAISPSGRPNVLHYEPLRDGRDWANLPDGQIVLHVESMVKAKAVHKWTGYPTIGLNGVDSFASSKRGVAFLYADQEIDFGRFTNVVLYDSNTWKPQVAQARERLMFKFKHILGCKNVRFVDLPKTITGEDQGPDDFLHDNGNEALSHLIENSEEYKGGQYDALLSRMDRALYCARSGAVVDKEDKNVRSTSKARDFYANINEKELNKAGRVTTVAGFSVWLESDKRGEVLNPAYQYLGPEYIEREDGTYYNLFTPGGAEPGGSVEAAQPMIDHIKAMVDSEDFDRLRSYLKFLKFSPKKPTSFPVMYSDRRGVGKGWFGLLAIKLIGALNGRSGNSTTFSTNFNAELEGKRVIVLNDLMIDGGSKSKVMNAIKNFTGDEMIRIERKGVDAYEIEARGGLIINTNALEDVPNDGFEDRRIWYVECHAVSIDSEYWSKLFDLLKDPDAMSGFAQWVLEAEDVDFQSWRPPMNERREDAITESMRPMEAATFRVKKMLIEDGYICCSQEQVKMVLERTQGLPFLENVTSQGLAAAMKKGTWKNSSKKTYGEHGKQGRVWIVDEDKFAAIEDNVPAVNAELRRMTSGSTKY